MSKDKGNGHTTERRSGFDRRILSNRDYAGSERRTGGLRRKADRAADKPIKR